MQDNGTETPITSLAEAPVSEVRAKRRQFTVAQKLAILREVDTCPAGQIGVVLRRQGLYSSQLSVWRQARDAGELAPKTRGPKSDPHAKEMARLQRENATLQARLHKSELIIDAQKKLLQVLGLPEPDLTELDAPK
jgi:transposase-like protein